ncbi:MAG: hypothetical protein ACKOU6_05360 [Planctomycetota bacterium]
MCGHIAEALVVGKDEDDVGFFARDALGVERSGGEKKKYEREFDGVSHFNLGHWHLFSRPPQRKRPDQGRK